MISFSLGIMKKPAWNMKSNHGGLRRHQNPTIKNDFFNPIRSGLFYRLKVQEGVRRDPLKISRTIEGSLMKLSTLIALLKVYQNT